MGNALALQYDIRDQVASGGPGHLWEIRTATKKSTSEPCSLFIFEKSIMEQMNPFSKVNTLKRELQVVLDALKKEAQMMTKLRHPSILQVLVAPEDTPTGLGLATEPVLYGFSNLLGDTTRFESLNLAELQTKYSLDDFEIRKGLLQLIGGLKFLSSNNIILTCLAPEFVYVNAKGDWKITGFLYAVQINPGSTETPASPYTSVPPICLPHLGFVAPEVILDGKCCAKSHIWALGAFVVSLFNKGLPPIDCNSNTSLYRDILRKLSSNSLKYDGMPYELQASVERMIVQDPMFRVDLAEFERSNFFDNALINTMNYLESFVEKQSVEKAQFLKTLPTILPQFSTGMIVRKILPLLIQETRDHALSAFVMPSLFWIGEKISPQEFETLLLPCFQDILSRSDPPQATLLMLSRVDLLLSRTSNDNFAKSVLSSLLGALESSHLQIQDSAVRTIPQVATKLERHVVEYTLYPKLEQLFLATRVLVTKTNCAIAIASITNCLDKTTITKKLLPAIETERAKFNEAGLHMAFLSIYHQASLKLDKEQIATFVIPELWKMSMHRSFTLEQFEKFYKVINGLSEKVRDEHVSFLKEARGIEDSGKDLDSMVRSSTPQRPVSISADNSPSRGRSISLLDASPRMTFSPLRNNTTVTSFNSSSSAHIKPVNSSSLFHAQPSTPERPFGTNGSTGAATQPMPSTGIGGTISSMNGFGSGGLSSQSSFSYNTPSSSILQPINSGVPVSYSRGSNQKPDLSEFDPWK